MSTTQDGDTARRTPGPDGELPARLLAFLDDSPAPDLPTADPVLVRRLRARATGCAGTRVVPEPRRGQATSR
ncbi:hypothetical protein [Geodermatophilus sp. SYSU D01119]